MDNMSDNQINQKIGILLRREIEARLITQFKKYLSSELGEKKSKHIIREVIKGVAIEQGRELSKLNGNSLNSFIDRQEPWTRDGSLVTDVIKKITIVIIIMLQDVNMPKCIKKWGYKIWVLIFHVTGILI